jgi:hypothetical protein
VNYADLGPCRVSPMTTRRSVATGGESIVSRINESLAAKVREARAERDADEDFMQGSARVLVAPSVDAWMGRGGTLSW